MYTIHAQIIETPEIPVWRYALGGSVIGHPVAQVESVVVATDGGNLKALSSAGIPLWDYYAQGRLTPHISRSPEGTSYICRTNGRLIAVNRAGRELWSLFLSSPLIFPVITGWDGRLFAFSGNEITCITASGNILWKRVLTERITLAPVLDSSGGVIFLLESGELLSVNPYGSIYSYKPTKKPAAAASVELPETGPTVLLMHDDGSCELVYTLLKYGVIVEGRVNLSSAPHASIGRKKEAAILLKDGSLMLFSPENRAIIWKVETHIKQGELSGTQNSGEVKFLFDERGIYVMTKNGASGFAHNGRMLWSIRLSGTSAVPVFGDDGMLFSGGEDWILYAYYLENRVKEREQLFYGEAPEGRYLSGTQTLTTRRDGIFTETEILRRFSEIRTAIRTGNVGENEKDFISFLMQISGSFLPTPYTAISPPIHVQHRTEAIWLLGFIGSKETVPFLADLFNRDRDTLIKTAAAESIGRIGVDPEGYALDIFSNAMLNHINLFDERALTALAAATGALCRFSGPPLLPMGLKILLSLSSNDMFPVASRKAQQEIDMLLRQ